MNKVICELIFWALILIAVKDLTSAEISISSVSEGICIKPVPKPVKFDIMWAIEFGPKAKYVVMANELYLAYTTQFIRGSALQNFEETKKMCPTINSDGISSTIKAFDSKKRLDCEIQSIGALLCALPEKMNNDKLTDDQKNGTAIVATWTDHKSYIVTVNCLPGGYKSWNVVSNHKTVDKATKATILKHIKGFGFDPTKAHDISYDLC